MRWRAQVRTTEPRRSTQLAPIRRGTTLMSGSSACELACATTSRLCKPVRLPTNRSAGPRRVCKCGRPHRGLRTCLHRSSVFALPVRPRFSLQLTLRPMPCRVCLGRSQDLRDDGSPVRRGPQVVHASVAACGRSAQTTWSSRELPRHITWRAHVGAPSRSPDVSFFIGAWRGRKRESTGGRHTGKGFCVAGLVKRPLRARKCR